MSGPCLSSSVAGRPLRPAIRLSLGEPLPHQLADRPRAYQKAPDLAVPALNSKRCPSEVTSGISSPFSKLFQTSWQITHVLRTLAPLNTSYIAAACIPLDLHVLSTPPAFVLSQNQTLRKNFGAGGRLLDSGQSLRQPSLKDRQFLTILACARLVSRGRFVRSYLIEITGS